MASGVQWRLGQWNSNESKGIFDSQSILWELGLSATPETYMIGRHMMKCQSRATTIAMTKYKATADTSLGHGWRVSISHCQVIQLQQIYRTLFDHIVRPYLSTGKKTTAESWGWMARVARNSISLSLSLRVCSAYNFCQCVCECVCWLAGWLMALYHPILSSNVFHIEMRNMGSETL